MEEFDFLPDWLAAGMTDYVAIITRFAAEGVIGDMDCVYTSWATRAPDGFEDHHVEALDRVVPFLALAIKSISFARMTSTLMETYLGRDPGRRVLAGKVGSIARKSLGSSGAWRAGMSRPRRPPAKLGRAIAFS